MVVDYYYNPEFECTCGAIYADTHRSWCKTRIRPIDSQSVQITKEVNNG